MSLEEIGLKGRLRVRIGCAADYRRLARFHYTHTQPASFSLTAVVDHVTSDITSHVVAAGVLSNPALNSKSREAALKIGGVPREWKWEYLNRHLRTISRVVVHPQYRGIGISSALVRFMLAQAPTRYVEAISMLAAHHPLFERAGMKCVVEAQENSPAYYLFDQLTRSRSLL